MNTSHFHCKTSKSEQTRSLIPNSAHSFFVNWILVSFYRTLISKHCTIIFTPSLIYGWRKSRWLQHRWRRRNRWPPFHFLNWGNRASGIITRPSALRWWTFPAVSYLYTHDTERCTTQLWKPEWNAYCFYLLESTSKPTAATSTTKKSSQNICL